MTLNWKPLISEELSAYNFFNLIHKCILILYFSLYNTLLTSFILFILSVFNLFFLFFKGVRKQY